MCGIGRTLIEGIKLFPNSIFVGVELEQKFVDWANQNIKKAQRVASEDMFINLGEVICVQGDARKLVKVIKEKVDKCIFSPPFGQAQSGGEIAKKGYDGPKHGPTDLVGKRSYMPENVGDKDNISNLPFGKADKIVTSPPYGEGLGHQHGTKVTSKLSLLAQKKGMNVGKYSEGKKNIGDLPHGKISKIITSPPYSETRMDGGGKGRAGMTPYSGEKPDTWRTQRNQNNLGNLPHGQVEKIVTSPPYSESIKTETDADKRLNRLDKAGYLEKKDWQRPGTIKTPGRTAMFSENQYSKDKNNIGNLKHGEIAKIVTSVKKGEGNRGKNRIIIPESELLKLVNEFQLKDFEIAKKYGISRTCVIHNRRRYGIKRIEIWQRKAGNLDNEQYQIVLGTTLGDASLVTNKECKYKSLSLSHSEKQLDYLLWKKEMLPNYFTNKLWKRKHKDKKGNNYYSYQVKSIVHPEFLKIYHKIYKNNKKGISLEVLNELTASGIAVWFMDDGCCAKGKKNWGGHLLLATDNFSIEENKLIVEWFQSKWGIKATISKKKQGTFSLYFPKENSRKLKELISPFIIPSMQYKLDVADSWSIAKQKVWDRKKANQPSYLSEMLLVYQQCFQILKSGGIMVLILKDFIKKGKRIPLGEHTRKLCEACGFKYITTYYRKIEHPSFWRTLQVQKYGEAYKIDSEDILVFEKPK